MKVCCISNTGVSLPDSYIISDLGYNLETQFQLTLGREYLVYAIYEWQGNVWYYICDDNYSYYPQQNPAPLFKVVDKTLSKHWKFELAPNGLLTIAFQEWFDDSEFYDKLTDMDEEAVSIFKRVKNIMDSEFS